MLKKLLFIALLTFANMSFAADLTVSGAKVTRVQVYETTDDSTNVWIHLNGNSRVGPNPDNTSTTCELWTNNKTVYSTALSAFMSGKKVTVSYVDRGDGTYWCKVRHLSVITN